jgi:tellurite resistance protein TehA-like permease
MGTGIVSIALGLHHDRTLSDALFALAALCWLGLGLVLASRVVCDRKRAVAEARSPAGLTGIAATAVLGARTTEIGWQTLGAALLVLAAIPWVPLTVITVRRIGRRVAGDWFMVTVAAEGVAALTAGLAESEHASWLAALALVPAAIGLVLYPLVLVRFDLGGLRAGRGEQWVAGGSLAISALAVAQVVVAARRLGAMSGATGALHDIALALWVGAILWLPALVMSELRWPRLRYHRHRWSTVFPLGMYAVCGFSVSLAARAGWIADFARWWTWVALAGWALTTAATMRRCLRYAPAGSAERSPVRSRAPSIHS